LAASIQIFWWLLKILVVLVLVVLGLVAGLLCIEEVDYYFGAVTLGFGVLVSLFILAPLAYFVVRWRKPTKVAKVAAAVSGALVAFAVLVGPYSEWEDRKIEGNTIAWFHPFSSLPAELEIDWNDFEVRYDALLTDYRKKRDEWQTGEGKEQTREVLNALANSTQKWPAAALELIPRLSKNAAEYEAWRLASIREWLDKGGRLPPGSFTTFSDHWAHLAVPDLKTSRSNNYPKPPFKVKHDYRTAIEALRYPSVGESVEAKAIRLTSLAEVMQLACIGDEKWCGEAIKTMNEAVIDRVATYESRKAELQELGAKAGFTDQQISTLYASWQGDSSYIKPLTEQAPRNKAEVGSDDLKNRLGYLVGQQAATAADVKVLMDGWKRLPEAFRDEIGFAVLLAGIQIKNIEAVMTAAETPEQRLLSCMLFDHAMVNTQMKWFKTTN
jgi:hypothetical protein